MEIREALDKLKQYLQEIEYLRTLHYDNDEWPLWRDKGLYVLEAAFGKGSDEYRMFLSSLGNIIGVVQTEAEKQKEYEDRLRRHENSIKSILLKYEIVGITGTSEESDRMPKTFVNETAWDLLQKRLSDLESPEVDAYDEPRFVQLREEIEAILRNTLGSESAPLEKWNRNLASWRWPPTYVGEPFDHYDRKRKEAFLSLKARLVAVLKAILFELENLAKTSFSKETIYASGTPYDAYKDIRQIVASVPEKLVIVDPYVDATLFSLLENVPLGVTVQVLTRVMQGDFELVGKKFKEQREKGGGGAVEVRKGSRDFHDRFIISDETVFHLGAYIKDAGSELCAISELQDPNNKSFLIHEIGKSWDKAKTVL